MFNQENIYHYGNIIPTQKELDGMLADLKLFCIVFTAASCFFPERNIVPLRKVLTSLPPESRIRYKKGFSHYESWGRWTAASQAELCISLPDELRGKTGKLRMKFFARVPSFSYSINNAPPQEIKCRQWQEECFIPYSKEQSQKQTLNITFRFKNLSSPKDNNESSDERKLGIGIQQISFGSK